MLSQSQLIHHHYGNIASVSFPSLSYMLKFSKVLWLNFMCLRILKIHIWSGLITCNITPEEDVQRCACPATPRHMCQCNELLYWFMKTRKRDT